MPARAAVCRVDDYLKDPARIEEKSFAMIREATDLSGFSEPERQVVMRLVHTSSHPQVAQQVRFSQDAVAAGITALNAGCDILCDTEMVRQGLSKRFLDNPPHCFLNDPAVSGLARQNNQSRSMTAVQFWTPYLKDSIAIFGNAPTALYRLMEMLEEGAAKPALVIGFPVGFVGAAESKQYLVDHQPGLGIEYITLLGRSGGSAMAAATFNALARLRRGIRC